ncbi:MAG: Uncharacterised protein [Puniceicoccaceae bacterium MED-G32]|nr:MAG: Uncharacterised protein [Puniceicoccaceae bacterium MED-G32]
MKTKCVNCTVFLYAQVSYLNDNKNFTSVFERLGIDTNRSG